MRTSVVESSSAIADDSFCAGFFFPELHFPSTTKNNAALVPATFGRSPSFLEFSPFGTRSPTLLLFLVSHNSSLVLDFEYEAWRRNSLCGVRLAVPRQLIFLEVFLMPPNPTLQGFIPLTIEVLYKAACYAGFLHIFPRLEGVPLS